MIFNVGSGGAGGSEVKGYWWKKSNAIDKVMTSLESTYRSTTLANYPYNFTNGVIYYSDSYETFVENGVAYCRLVNPQTKTVSASTSIGDIEGKYVATQAYVNKATFLYKLNVYDGSFYVSNMWVSGSTYTMRMYAYEKYSFTPYKELEVIDYVHAMNADAYPNGDTAEDGYYYSGRFTLLDNFMDTDNYELLAEHTQGNTTKNYNVPDLSQYKYFYVQGSESDYYFGAIYFIPASKFIANKINTFSYSNSSHFQITRTSDTRVQMYWYGIGSGSSLKLYGMK